MEQKKQERTLTFKINDSCDGMRLDKALSIEAEDMSRSFIQKLIMDGSVKVNEEACSDKKTAVRSGDIVEVMMSEPVPIDVEPQDIQLDILYEDDDLAVVNKPAGMVVHPAAGNPDGTLVNALMHRYKDGLSSINGVLRPGIVHRIDKDTSGILVVARNDKAHESLSKQLAEHSMQRRYLAIVVDNIRQDEGTVDEPIGRDRSNRLRNAVDPGGKSAVTRYRVLERFGNYTLVEAELETGRTHQIRVHMAWMKHPLLGDDLYGPAKNKVGATRQMLHARCLGFRHPEKNEQMYFECDPPKDFMDVLEKLRKKS